MLPAGIAMLLAGPAHGQLRQAQAEPGPAPAPEISSPFVPAAAPAPAGASPASDPLSPGQLMNGPSLRETGRVAVAPAPASGNHIENEEALKSPNEKAITPATSSIDVPPAPPRAGFIDPRVLDREIAERFTQIADCRIEVARAKQVTPPHVVADKLLLRWIIQTDGTIGQTEVVATAPVDLGIMDCAKRVMSQWKFTPPRGGPKAVERPFSFWRSNW